MVVLRRTRKLERILSVSASLPTQSDTALGDWYVNRLTVDRRPLLLLVSSHGLLRLSFRPEMFDRFRTASRTLSPCDCAALE